MKDSQDLGNALWTVFRAWPHGTMFSDSARSRSSIGRFLSIHKTSRRLPNSLAETQQGGAEKNRDDQGESEELWPDDIKRASPIDNSLRKFHEVGGGRADHDLLDELRHALARGYASREHLQWQKDKDHEVKHRAVALMSLLDPGDAKARVTRRTTAPFHLFRGRFLASPGCVCIQLIFPVAAQSCAAKLANSRAILAAAFWS